VGLDTDQESWRCSEAAGTWTVEPKDQPPPHPKVGQAQQGLMASAENTRPVSTELICASQKSETDYLSNMVQLGYLFRQMG
jgi:hypothetical protein